MLDKIQSDKRNTCEEVIKSIKEIDPEAIVLNKENNDMIYYSISAIVEMENINEISEMLNNKHIRFRLIPKEIRKI